MRKIYALRAEAFAESAQRHWQGLIDVPEIRAGLDIACHLQVESEPEAFTRLQAAGIDVLPLALLREAASTGAGAGVCTLR